MADEPEQSHDGMDGRADPQGPVVFAYDGSDLAKLAIREAARLLGPGRDALVLTIWQPFDVTFVPRVQLKVNAADAAEVRDAAQQTADDGASLAKEAGFSARGVELQVSPTWKGIVHAAEEHDASLIVLGSHGRSGISGVLLGSVAEAVAGHSDRSVLVVHRRD
ncbi:MAG TPA: universal stress protein [Solirubrobacteraceae bacterium]|nr:universal stress protein [Solirubrobacteraceae bacterium]